MSGYSQGTPVRYGRMDPRGCATMISQDTFLPKPINQLILSDNFFQDQWYRNQGITSICLRIKNHRSRTACGTAHREMPYRYLYRTWTVQSAVICPDVCTVRIVTVQ